MSTDADWIWSRLRDVQTDKPAGRVQHLIDTKGERRTLCGETGVSPDATLKGVHRCLRCSSTLKFHPDIEVREHVG